MRLFSMEALSALSCANRSSRRSSRTAITLCCCLVPLMPSYLSHKTFTMQWHSSCSSIGVEGDVRYAQVDVLQGSPLFLTLAP